MRHRYSLKASALTPLAGASKLYLRLQPLSLLFATVVNVLMLVGYGTGSDTPIDATRSFLMADIEVQNAPLGYFAVRVIIR